MLATQVVSPTRRASSMRVVLEQCGLSSNQVEVKGRIPLDCRHYAAALVERARELSRLIMVRPTKGKPFDVHPDDSVDAITAKLRRRPQVIEVRNDGSCVLCAEDYPVAAMDLLHVAKERLGSAFGVEVSLEYGTIIVKSSYSVGYVEKLLRENDQSHTASAAAGTRMH